MTPVLVVDDDPSIRRLLRLYLEKNGYTIHEAASCAEGASQFAGVKPSVVLLDLGLPDGDGRDLLAMIRQRGDTPVIVLSVRDSEADITGLLDGGADDYITKPFGIGEVIARLRVALRHRLPASVSRQKLAIGLLDVRMDPREASRNGLEEHLTPTEWSILEIFVRNPGKIITRNQLLREVWGPAVEQDYNSLRVYINQLRKKIEQDPSAPKFLRTEPGVGYRLRLELPDDE
ncbi:MAG: response regulator transcription factor [Spirochaetes bacterium]|nr:response regulator transcription factor [Spirochaetota bacterium]MBU0955874.1 response regulator transcription factor [Spirochaetota bacterium]